MTLKVTLVGVLTAFVLGAAGPAVASDPGSCDDAPDSPGCEAAADEPVTGFKTELSQDEEVTEDFVYELPSCGGGQSLEPVPASAEVMRTQLPRTASSLDRSSSSTAQPVGYVSTADATSTSDGTFECAPARRRCYVGQWKKKEDWFPYRRWVHQRTRWCASNGWVVSTSTVDWAHTDPGCSLTWGPETRRSRLNSSIVHLATRAQFSCNLYFTDLTDWVELRVDVMWNGKATKR